MSILNFDLEIAGHSNFLRLLPGDCSLRIGSWTVTALWGADPRSDGLFFEREADRARDRYWQWDELAKVARTAFGC